MERLSYIGTREVRQLYDFFSERDGLIIRNRGCSYVRREPRIINGFLTRPSISNRYRNTLATVPDQGVAQFRNSYVFGNGLIINEDGDVIRESIEKVGGNHTYDSIPCSIEVSEAIDEAVFISKVGARNYGHFLVEMLPRLVLYDKDVPSDIPIILSYKAKGFAPQMVAAAGFDPNRLVFIGNESMMIRNLYWPIRNTFHPMNNSPHIMSVFERLKPPSPCGLRRKLFVSRRDAPVRQLRNDQEIFSELELEGFEWIAPGSMSFLEQVRTFSEAEIVVGVAGAALTNIVFMPPRGDVIMLAPKSMGGFFFWDLAHHAKLDFTVIFGETDVDRDSDKNSDFYIDPLTLRTVLKDVYGGKR